ncbi:MAG: leucine-rich repeat protein [Oscillospiraceae bacterium]|nr:leucine-rich repeat protein [Oscillospiraceae bacterium]
MKRFLSFVLSFAVMFSMFAPSAYALENTPSVLTLDEEDTIRVYYKVNDSLEYKDIANREIELTDNDVVELIADDLSTGEMVEIEQVTFNPSGYSTASVSGGVATIDVGNASDFGDLITAEIIAGGQTFKMYFYALPPKEETDIGIRYNINGSGGIYAVPGNMVNVNVGDSISVDVYRTSTDTSYNIASFTCTDETGEALAITADLDMLYVDVLEGASGVYTISITTEDGQEWSIHFFVKGEPAGGDDESDKEEIADDISATYYLNGDYAGFANEPVSAEKGDTVTFKIYNYTQGREEEISSISYNTIEGVEASHEGGQITVVISEDTEISTFDITAHTANKDYLFTVNVVYFDWSYSNGVLTIDGNGPMPEYSDSSMPWKDYRDSVTAIKFMPGVTTIVNSAFYGFSELRSVEFLMDNGAPSNLRRIGNNAFAGCKNLTEFDLPDNLEELWGGAFSGTGITSLILPATLTDVSPQSFSGMDALTNVGYNAANPLYTVMNSVLLRNETELFAAFPYTSYLMVPAKVTSISGHAFLCAEKLTNFDVMSSNTKFTAVDGVLFSKDKATLIAYPMGRTETSYTIPDGTKSFDNFAFNNSKLEELCFYPSIESISFSAFTGADKLKTVKFHGTESQFKDISNSDWFESNGIEVICLKKDGFDTSNVSLDLKKDGNYLSNTDRAMYNVTAGDDIVVYITDGDEFLKYADRDKVGTPISDTAGYECYFADQGQGIFMLVVNILENTDGVYSLTVPVDGIDHVIRYRYCQSYSDVTYTPEGYEWAAGVTAQLPFSGVHFLPVVNYTNDTAGDIYLADYDSATDSFAPNDYLTSNILQTELYDDGSLKGCYVNIDKAKELCTPAADGTIRLNIRLVTYKADYDSILTWGFKIAAADPGNFTGRIMLRKDGEDVVTRYTGTYGPSNPIPVTAGEIFYLYFFEENGSLITRDKDGLPLVGTYSTDEIPYTTGFGADSYTIMVPTENAGKGSIEFFFENEANKDQTAVFFLDAQLPDLSDWDEAEEFDGTVLINGKEYYSGERYHVMPGTPVSVTLRNSDGTYVLNKEIRVSMDPDYISYLKGPASRNNTTANVINLKIRENASLGGNYRVGFGTWDATAGSKVAYINFVAASSPFVIDGGEYQGIEYQVYSDGTLKLNSGSSTVLGNGEQLIAPWAQEHGSLITKVYVGSGITEISNWAFYGLNSLKTISIGEDVKTIADWAFAYVKGLVKIEVDQNNGSFITENGLLMDKAKTAVYAAERDLRGELWLPETLTQIKPHAFIYTQLTSVIVGPEVQWVGGLAFAQSETLKKVIFRGGLEDLEAYVFDRSYNLREVAFPDTLKEFGSGVFNGLKPIEDYLLNIVYEGTYEQWQEITDGVDFGLDYGYLPPFVYTTEGSCFVNVWNRYPDIAKVYAPKSDYEYGEIVKLTTKLKDENYSINYITLDGEPFYGTQFVAVRSSHSVCIDSLKYNITGGNVTDSIYWNFSEEEGSLAIYGEGAMPDFEEDEYAPWYMHRDYISEIIVDEGITTIGDYAFYDCYNADTIVIPDGITYIGNLAFYNCEQVNSIRIPDTVKTIADQAFANMYTLRELSLPAELETIGDRVFEETGIASLYIPAGIEYIDGNMFGGCECLEELVVDEDNANYKSVDGVIYSKDGTKLVAYPGAKVSDIYTVPAEVTEIVEGAFYYAAVQTVEFEAGSQLKVIGGEAFCSSDLRYIELPEGLETIGVGAFDDLYNCDIWLPSTVSSIGRYAFSYDASVNVAISPNNPWYYIEAAVLYKQSDSGVELVDGKRFTGSELVVPKGVTVVVERAIESNEYIERIVFPATLELIKKESFIDCYKLREMVIPASVTKIENHAFSWCDALETIYYGGTEAQWNKIIDEYSITSDSDYEVIFNHSAKDIYVESLGGSCTVTVNGVPYEDVMDDIWSGDEIVISDITPDEYNQFSVIVLDGEKYDLGDDGTFSFTVKDDHKLQIIFERGRMAEGTFGNLDWAVYYDGGLGIFGKGNMENVDVEESDSEYPYPWYEYRDCVNNITVEEGVTSVADYAFSGFEYAEKVVLPDSLTKIGRSAFERTSISEIELPKNLAHIGGYAFAGTYIDTLTIPAKVKTIEAAAFTGMENLAEIIIAAENPNFAFEDGILYGKKGTNKVSVIKAMDMLIPAGADIVIPDTVTEIGNSAFSDCQNIATITLGSKVATIGRSAFAYGVFDAIILGDGVKTIESYAFNGTSAWVDMGENVTTIKEAAFVNAQIYDLEMGGKVKTVEPYAFANSELSRVMLSSALKAIPEGAFIRNYSLSEVYIPKSVSSIGASAFEDCANLAVVCFGGTQAQWEKLKVAAGNEALENATVLFNVAKGVFDAKVFDRYTYEEAAEKQTFKHYVHETELDYIFEISRFRTDLADVTIESDNQNVIVVKDIRMDRLDDIGSVEREVAEVKLAVVGAGKATVTFKAADQYTGVAVTRKITYTVEQMATTADIAINGLIGGIGTSIVAGGKIKPEIRWIGGKAWDKSEYRFEMVLDNEEEIRFKPEFDPQTGLITTTATKLNKDGSVKVQGTQSCSGMLRFYADCGYVSVGWEAPFRIYSEAAKSVQLTSTKVVLDAAAGHYATEIYGWVENGISQGGNACDEVRFTWTENENIRVSEIFDGERNGVYVELLNGSKATVNITATAADGSKKSAKCTVTSGVIADYIAISSDLPATEVYVEEYDEDTGMELICGYLQHHILAAGKSSKIASAMAPANATDKTVIWTSSDPSVITVDAKGTVKALKAGTAKITARPANGFAESEIRFIVTEPATAVEINWQNEANQAEGITATPNKKDSITVPVKDQVARVMLDVSLVNGSDFTADRVADFIDLAVSGKNTEFYYGYDEGEQKFWIEMCGAGTLNVTAKAKDGSGKSAKLAIVAEQQVFAMEVQQPAGIGAEYNSDLGTMVWAVNEGTTVKPVVQFNWGIKQLQPAKAYNTYEIVLRSGSEKYLELSKDKKSVKVIAKPQDDETVGFTVKSGSSTSSLIPLNIIPKGEKYLAQYSVRVAGGNGSNFAAGSTVSLETWINGKKGLNGFVSLGWKIEKFTGSYDDSGNPIMEEVTDPDTFIKGSKFTLGENLEPGIYAALQQIGTDKNDTDAGWYSMEFYVTAKPKAEDIRLRRVEYTEYEGMYIVTGETEDYLTAELGNNIFTPADKPMLYKLETTAGAMEDGYTFKSSAAKGVIVEDEIWAVDESTLGTDNEMYDRYILVTPKAKCDATITVTAGDGTKVSTKLRIKVEAVENAVNKINTDFKAIALDWSDTVAIGYSLEGKDKELPISHTDILWTSSNPEILMLADKAAFAAEEAYPEPQAVTSGTTGSLALVAMYGKTGKVTVTGTTQDGSNKTVKINVTVEKDKGVGYDSVRLYAPANTANGGVTEQINGENVALLTWGKNMKFASAIISNNPKGKTLSYTVEAVTAPHGLVVEGVPNLVTIDKNGTLKAGKYFVNKKTGEEVIPYTGWVKVTAKLGYEEWAWDDEIQDMNFVEIRDEMYVYIQQPATGVEVRYEMLDENFEYTGDTVSKNATITVPAGRYVYLFAEPVFACTSIPDLTLGAPTFSIGKADYIWYQPLTGVTGDGEMVQTNDRYMISVQSSAPVGASFKVKAFAQDGSGKATTITIKVGEPL